MRQSCGELTECGNACDVLQFCPLLRGCRLRLFASRYIHRNAEKLWAGAVVSLYATSGSLAKGREPVLRWAPWLHGGYDLTQIPGTHFTLFEPEHVAGLAAALGTSLARDAVER